MTLRKTTSRSQIVAGIFGNGERVTRAARVIALKRNSPTLVLADSRGRTLIVAISAAAAAQLVTELTEILENPRRRDIQRELEIIDRFEGKR